MVFTYAFYQHIMFRHSCGVCHYCNTRRPSDITIADFWGWEKTNPEANKDDKGLSLLLINTEKGRQLFEAIKGELNYFPARLDDVLQPNLQHPSVIHPQRMEFERYYARHGFKSTMQHFGFMGWRFESQRLVHRAKGKAMRMIRKALSAMYHISQPTTHQ